MNAQKEILKKYGKPDVIYQSKYCILWMIQIDFPWFPKERIFINKDFKNKLYAAFKELEAAGLHTEIKTEDGCFEIRKVRANANLTSLHSWAMAMDLNAAAEKLGQVKTNWSPEFIAIMTKYVFWGGNFHDRHDNMHFALYNG